MDVEIVPNWTYLRAQNSFCTLLLSVMHFLCVIRVALIKYCPWNLGNCYEFPCSLCLFFLIFLANLIVHVHSDVLSVMCFFFWRAAPIFCFIGTMWSNVFKFHLSSLVAAMVILVRLPSFFTLMFNALSCSCIMIDENYINITVLLTWQFPCWNNMDRETRFR